jgi:hypothetical protein
MKKNRTFFGLVAIVFTILITVACIVSGPSPQEDQAAFNTAVAQTSQAQFIQMTIQAQSDSPTQPPPTAPPTDAAPTSPSPTLPSPTSPPPTNTPTDVYAPDPLGPAWSGMAFNSGTCYDLDVLFTASDATADVCLDANVVLTPQNGAKFSGSGFMTPPSLNDCKNTTLTGDQLAPITDAYLCFQTNAGSYGFFVMRDDQMLSSGYIVFDAYIFP